MILQFHYKKLNKISIIVKELNMKEIHLLLKIGFNKNHLYNK